MKSLSFYGGEYFFHISAIGYFKLFVALFFAAMAAYAYVYTCGDLGGGYFYDIIPETGTFSGGYGDACKGQKQSVGADYLQKLLFVYVIGVYFIIVY